MEIKEIESHISKVPDYPKPGILFYDISTLIFNKDAFSSSIKKLTDKVKDYEFDCVNLPIEGCACPEGMARNSDGVCINIDDCPA